MRAKAIAIAVCVGGCLAAPPPPSGDDRADGGGGGSADSGHAAEADDAGGVAEGCLPGSALDLMWVSEMAFDHLAQDQVTLRGLALVINPGPDPVYLGPLSVVPSVDGGAVQAYFSLTGGDLTLPAGEVMGVLNTGASVVLTQWDDEAWTNLHAPELDVVLRFDGTGVDAAIPVHLAFGGYSFDLSILVAHTSAPPYEWARAASRSTAICQ